MRAWIVFRKTLREMTRDLWVVGLTLVFAPLFVFLYWLWFSGGSTSYGVLLLDHDQGAPLPSGVRFRAGEEVLQALQDVTYADGKPLLRAVVVGGRAQAEDILRERGAVAFVELPQDFSRTLLLLRSGDRSVSTEITFGGDLTNPYYAVGSALALTAIDAYVQEATGQQPIVRYVERPLAASAAAPPGAARRMPSTGGNGSAARSEFEIYVPGVMIFAVILLIFQAAMTVAREIETGALQRLQLTPMSAFDLLGGITAALALVGVASVCLTFGTAAALGFQSYGPLWVALLVGGVTSLSVIGIGLVVACFTRTVSQAFVVANFPLGLMMFFSGAIFPLPKVTLFTLGGRAIGLYDVLPPTHAVAALNKILTLGAGLSEVSYELGALAVLSALYFFAGVWLFRRTQLGS